MGKVKEVDQKSKENSPKGEELKVFQEANLVFKCHCCGNTNTVEEGVKGGIRFDLYTTNKHKLVMACSQCKAMLEMYFEEVAPALVVNAEGKAVKSNKKVRKPIVEATGEEEIADIPEGRGAPLLDDLALEDSTKKEKEKINEIPLQEENTEEKTA